MRLNSKKADQQSRMPLSIAVGCLVSVIITIFGSAVSAWLMDSEKLQESAIGYAAAVIILISAFAGCVVAVTVAGKQRLPVAAITGISYTLVLLAVTALFFGGEYEGVGVTALLIAAGTVCSLLIGMRGKKRVTQRKQIVRNR